ncbi:D-Ala-D-Ala carboxypeptidase family metallohydrolase [Algihabitans albus]|uniref:D-Ala-D-Ala carboxypeptidase family metallohydrolase n=1 Tax=Algihabitans albus TaxID=2164067 RepID=UPI000E5CD0F4|nr:D-Ala-D-Ala carboxypeptidase family metallohydrolase [Algihabitans albus]
MALVTDWSRYPNFTESEFVCSHTGRCEMQSELLDKLQALRSQLGQPLVVSSGYRDPSHPVEGRKVSPGAHAYGYAVDLRCNGQLAYLVLAFAAGIGFERIGVAQKGARGSRFIHLDTWPDGPAPAVWSY